MHLDKVCHLKAESSYVCVYVISCIMSSDILGQVYLESHFTARRAQSFQTVLLSLGYKEKKAYEGHFS